MKKAFEFVQALAILLLAACAGKGAAVASEDAAESLPLAAYAQRALLVLPLQQVLEEPGGLSSQSPRAADFREAMNYEIPFAFGESAPARWVFAPRIIEASRRNIGLSANPQKLAIEQLSEKLPEAEQSLSETLRTQVRQIVALTDARYALLPVFVRFDQASQNGMRPATMRLVLIDTRLAQVRWAADIRSEPTVPFSRSSAASLASRLAVLAGLR